jgi:hypothetical protein
VGSTPRWAGVTLDPVIRKEGCGTSSLFELVWGSFPLLATQSPAADLGEADKGFLNDTGKRT